MDILEFNPVLDQAKFISLYEDLFQYSTDPSYQEALGEYHNNVQNQLLLHHQLKEGLKDGSATLIYDKDGRILEVDEKFCALSKLSKDSILGEFISDWMKDKTHRTLFKDGLNNLGEHGMWIGEICFETTDQFWLKMIVIPLKEKADSVICYAIDITAYKHEELNKLNKVKADYLRTVDALVNLVFKVWFDKDDDEFYYVMFEGKLARDIGLTTNYVTGKTLLELFGPDQSLFYKQQYEKAFRGHSFSYKHSYNHRHFHTTLSPIEEEGTISEIIGSTVEVTMYEEAESKIRHMTYHDPLTDLPNRRKLYADLNRLLDKSILNPAVTVLFCDLDRFKYVNDALGHVSGDQVIQVVGTRINSCLERDMYLYRLTGDEFMVVMKGSATKQKVLQMGRKVLDCVKQPILLKGQEIIVTASIGVACSSAGETSQKLIAHADIAKHYCKVRGRDSVLYYTADMNRSYNQHLTLESSLRKAILNQELTLYYQPKVDVETGYLSGMEALVRWKDSEKGWISPGEFIPLAEEAGVISQIDEWVLYEACRQNKEWIDRGYAPERVAVNVSANEIQHDNFAEKVKAVLIKTGLPAKYLEIEVTENSVMKNTEECIRTMQNLKSMGVTLSIDDFGTGYSSLSYLRQFPIHYLKIDQTFIRNVRTDPSDAEIVKAIIQLADAFKLGVVAEGVECEKVLNFLKELHCQSYQGFYFSKPLPPENIEKLMTKKMEYRP
ncbi:EAL and GGDEF domain-containing protein [Halobacillus seohaensis]|uniref:EAL domain-containing protein n=1 Tax=Halobacillus seohaensis TaxID=447421 RepID=A0ABW2EI16_9BACI